MVCNVMTRWKIKFHGIEDVKTFVSIVSKVDAEFDLSSLYGRYSVDAKSILGVCSLDLSKKLDLRIYTDDDDIINSLKSQLKEYIVE